MYGREARLRQALAFLKNQIESIDGDGNGIIAAGGLLILFHSDLKVLQISETRHLAEYVIQQSGQEVPEAAINEPNAWKPFLECQIRVSFFLQLMEQLLAIRF